MYASAAIILQVNMKLGGANGILKNSLLMQMPTMVIGVDVNHGKVGSDQNSYAAVVATLDEHCTKFHTEVRVCLACGQPPIVVPRAGSRTFRLLRSSCKKRGRSVSSKSGRL